MNSPAKMTAASRYKDLREDIDQSLSTIESALDQHPPSNRLLIHWGHVGDLTYFLELLNQVEDSLLSRRKNGEGKS